MGYPTNFKSKKKGLSKIVPHGGVAYNMITKNRLDTTDIHRNKVCNSSSNVKYVYGQSSVVRTNGYIPGGSQNYNGEGSIGQSVAS